MRHAIIRVLSNNSCVIEIFVIRNKTVAVHSTAARALIRSEKTLRFLLQAKLYDKFTFDQTRRDSVEIIVTNAYTVHSTPYLQYARIVTKRIFCNR